METPRKTILEQVRTLENRVEELTQENLHLHEQVNRQGEEAFEMAGATMQIRVEDAERLAAFQKTNTELVEFVEAISDSRSKFASKARQILGFC